MPKAKPTQVIVHRIELQQTERDAMEAALAGRFVTNAVSATGSVLTGMGNLLAPFGGVLTAIAGLWIAEKGATALIDAVGTTIENTEDFVDFLNPKKQQDAYQYICAYLAACSGWDGDENSVSAKVAQLLKDLKGMNANPVLLVQFQLWMKRVKREHQTTGSWPPLTPALSWKRHYPPNEYLKEITGQIKDAIPGI